MTSIQIMDNLFSKQLVDPVTYLESVPSSAIPNKSKIVEKAKESMAQNRRAALLQEESAERESAAAGPGKNT